MKLVLIAPGCMPIPSPGWGAVERIVWDYYELLSSRGYNVVIVNRSDHHGIITECNANKPDVVHIMYDDHIIVAPGIQCPKIYYTSHFAYLTHPELSSKYNGYYMGIFRKVIDNCNRVVLNVISDEIRDLYVRNGFPVDKINVIRNGARDDKFIYLEEPAKGDRSIYLGKVEYRKAQYKYQGIESIDFVGNYHDSPFNRDSVQYKGEWSKDKIYQEMTNYGNLVLLSDGEADPLVVKEALMAGLGVVVSECASANLDRSREFITVVPDNKRDDLEYVRLAIQDNREKSIKLRDEIRHYALEKFGWSRIMDEYCGKCLG
jgi:glycosyltransferase involved in cell wall biosynthesis